MADTCAGAGLSVCVHVQWSSPLQPLPKWDLSSVPARVYCFHGLYYKYAPTTSSLRAAGWNTLDGVPTSVLFFSPSLRLSCKVLSFSFNQSCPCTMISHSLSGIQTQRGDTGQQLPMSGNSHLCSGFIDWEGLTDLFALHYWLCSPLCWWLCSTLINVYCWPLRMCAVNAWCMVIYFCKTPISSKQ